MTVWGAQLKKTSIASQISLILKPTLSKSCKIGEYPNAITLHALAADSQSL